MVAGGDGSGGYTVPEEFRGAILTGSGTVAGKYVEYPVMPPLPDWLVELVRRWDRKVKAGRREDGPGIAALPEKQADYSGWMSEWDLLPDEDE